MKLLSYVTVAFLFGADCGVETTGQSIPLERPRARPASELTGWAQWERASNIFSHVKVPPAPPLAPDEAMKSFKVADGFRLELFAAEPMVVHPIFFEFDSDGRIWAIEYRGYMRDLEGSDEGDPICRVVVLEDNNHDGRADKSTVFLDGLVMPRTLAFVEGGVLVAEPPKLWYCRDTNGDLRCDSKVQVGTYGRAGNPQHTANGLAYGIDNWLHSADWDRKHRFRDGRLIEEPAVYRGQFGVSFDVSGRYVTCRESSPAEMDLIPEEYIRRNTALLKSHQRSNNRARFGIAVPIGRAVNECFPIRPTPAITLGGLELRGDGTLRTYTIVAGTGVYLGDQFPPDAYGNIFVPEAGGHLIGRLKVDEGVEPRCHRYYPNGQEILASTDERFRPMSIRTGPDGALYFADMYKGIIEHVIFMAPYIADQIKARNLAAGNDMGRIYRLVSTAKPINREPPRLSTASSEKLIEQLCHGNGWRRITAQRLLVERRESSAIAPLRRMISEKGANATTRLHALWALEGLEALDWPAVLAAITDADEIVRAAALRLGERLLARGPNEESFRARLLQAKVDPSPRVRLQATLSLGAMESSYNQLAEVLMRDSSPLFRTAVLSGLAGAELQLLQAVGNDPAWASAASGREAFLREFAEMALDNRSAELISAIFDLARKNDWRSEPLIQGLLNAAPADLSAFKPIKLEREPDVIKSLLKGGVSDTRARGWRLKEMFIWPGDERADANSPSELKPEQQKLFVQGRELYLQVCAPCHQPHGGGLANVAPPLNGSEWVAGPPERLVRIVSHGLFGPLHAAGTDWNHSMPGFRQALAEPTAIAAVLTYVRRAWDNTSEPVEPAFVEQVRAATPDRELPWTAEELLGLEPAKRNIATVRPEPSGELLLTARLATCYGERLAYRPALDILAPWRKENDIALWLIEIPEAKTYHVFVTLAADNASAGDDFFIESEMGRVRGTVGSTRGYDQFRAVSVGELKLKAGANRIVMRPAGKLRAELADVKGLRLVP